MDQVIKNLRERKEAHGAKCVEISGILRRYNDQHQKLVDDLNFLLARYPDYRNERERQLAFNEREKARADQEELSHHVERIVSITETWPMHVVEATTAQK